MSKCVAESDSPLGVELEHSANKVEEALIDVVLAQDYLLLDASTGNQKL